MPATELHDLEDTGWWAEHWCVFGMGPTYPTEILTQGSFTIREPAFFGHKYRVVSNYNLCKRCGRIIKTAHMCSDIAIWIVLHTEKQTPEGLYLLAHALDQCKEEYEAKQYGYWVKWPQ